MLFGSKTKLHSSVEILDSIINSGELRGRDGAVVIELKEGRKVIDRGTIYFRSELVYAVSLESTPTPIASRVHTGGKVAESSLQEIVSHCGKNPYSPDIVRQLLINHLIDEELLDTYIKEHFLDQMATILSWDNCVGKWYLGDKTNDFTMPSVSFPYLKGVVASREIKKHDFVKQVSHFFRPDEFPQLVFIRTGNNKRNFSSEVNAIIALCNGSATFEQIAEETGIGNAVVMQTINLLWQQGIISLKYGAIEVSYESALIANAPKPEATPTFDVAQTVPLAGTEKLEPKVESEPELSPVMVDESLEIVHDSQVETLGVNDTKGWDTEETPELEPYIEEIVEENIIQVSKATPHPKPPVVAVHLETTPEKDDDDEPLTDEEKDRIASIMMEVEQSFNGHETNPTQQSDDKHFPRSETAFVVLRHEEITESQPESLPEETIEESEESLTRLMDSIYSKYGMSSIDLESADQSDIIDIDPIYIDTSSLLPEVEEQLEVEMNESKPQDAIQVDATAHGAPIVLTHDSNTVYEEFDALDVAESEGFAIEVTADSAPDVDEEETPVIEAEDDAPIMVEAEESVNIEETLISVPEKSSNEETDTVVDLPVESMTFPELMKRLSQLQAQESQLDESILSSRSEEKSISESINSLESDYEAIVDGAGEIEKEAEAARARYEELSGQLEQKYEELTKLEDEISVLKSDLSNAEMNTVSFENEKKALATDVEKTTRSFTIR